MTQDEYRAELAAAELGLWAKQDPTLGAIPVPAWAARTAAPVAEAEAAEVGGLVAEVVDGAVAGDLDRVVFAGVGLLTLGADRADLGGDTELGYAVADVLDCLAYLDRDGLDVAAAAVAAAAGR